MLQSTSLQQKILRSLQNIKHQSSKLQPHQLLPSYYYSGQLLHQYANQKKHQNKENRFFEEFIGLFDKFINSDSEKFKIHHKEIVGEIHQLMHQGQFHRYVRHLKQAKVTISKSIDTAKFPQFSNEDENVQQTQPKVRHVPQSLKKKSSGVSNPQQNLLTIAEITSTGSSQNIQQQNIEKQQYQKIVQSYRQHRIDQAFQLKQKYQKKYDLNQEKKKLFSTIDLEYKTMMSFYEEFDQEGWIFDKQDNGITLEYKVFEEEKQVGVRVSAELNVPIVHFLAVISETDLFEKFVPFCYGSRTCKVVSRNQKIGTSKVFIPCLTDREVYFYAAGYDRIKKNGSVFLFSKTINDDIEYQQKYGFKVPEKTEYVRLQYKFYIIEYIPINMTKGKVRLAVKVDMKLNYLPLFIINLSARKFAFDYFKNIPKISKKFKGSEWQKKVEQNPYFYQFFSKKIDEYMKK